MQYLEEYFSPVLSSKSIFCGFESIRCSCAVERMQNHWWLRWGCCGPEFSSFHVVAAAINRENEVRMCCFWPQKIANRIYTYLAVLCVWWGSSSTTDGYARAVAVHERCKFVRDASLTFLRWQGRLPPSPVDWRVANSSGQHGGRWYRGSGGLALAVWRAIAEKRGGFDGT
jgi:hypothetical protein